MADNQNLDAVNRHNGQGSAAFELQYLQDMLGVSREEILQAIEAVGNDRSKIASYLKDQREQSN